MYIQTFGVFFLLFAFNLQQNSQAQKICQFIISRQLKSPRNLIIDSRGKGSLTECPALYRRRLASDINGQNFNVFKAIKIKSRYIYIPRYLRTCAFLYWVSELANIACYINTNKPKFIVLSENQTRFQTKISKSLQNPIIRTQEASGTAQTRSLQNKNFIVSSYDNFLHTTLKANIGSR